MRTALPTIHDVDAATWARSRFVAAAAQRYSILAAGTYDRVLKLPIGREGEICLARHRIYGESKYSRLAASPVHAAALVHPSLGAIQNAIVFNGAASHWHYLLDGIASLRGLAGLGPRALYVDQDLSDEQIRFLLACAREAGCDEFRAVVRVGGPFFHVEDCVFACRSELSDNAAYLRELWRLDAAPLADAPRRLFVLRTGTDVRRLENQDEIAAALAQRLGFVAVDPAAHPLEAQRRMFQGAEILVGAHGAGLANALFAHRPKLLVELYHATQQPFYSALAEALDARHLGLRGESVVDTAGARRPDNAPYRIDAASVVAALEAAL
jgi:hypothetical protein